MKYIYLAFCLLLLLYNFKSTSLLSGNKNNRVIALWTLMDKTYLLQIFPHDVYILIDNNNFYLYLENYNEETYVPAINLNTNYKINIRNFIYLKDWSVEFSPKFIHYSESHTDLIDVINSIPRTII